MEKLKDTTKYIEQYGNNIEFMKINLKQINSIIKNLEDNNETIFINAWGNEFTINDLKKMRNLYKKIIKDAKI